MCLLTSKPPRHFLRRLNQRDGDGVARPHREHDDTLYMTDGLLALPLRDNMIECSAARPLHSGITCEKNTIFSAGIWGGEPPRPSSPDRQRQSRLIDGDKGKSQRHVCRLH